MKVKKTYIIGTTFEWKVLFYCEGDLYFILDKGGFGQRDMSIRETTEKEAQELVDKTNQPNQ